MPLCAVALVRSRISSDGRRGLATQSQVDCCRWARRRKFPTERRASPAEALHTAFRTAAATLVPPLGVPRRITCPAAMLSAGIHAAKAVDQATGWLTPMRIEVIIALPRRQTTCAKDQLSYFLTHLSIVFSTGSSAQGGRMEVPDCPFAHVGGTTGAKAGAMLHAENRRDPLEPTNPSTLRATSFKAALSSAAAPP